MHEPSKAFRGAAPAKIDERGRLKIPSAFRELIETSAEVFVTTYETPAVRIYPIGVYASRVEGNLDTHGGLDREAARTLRLLNARGHPAQVDGQARLTLGQSLRQRTRLVAGTEVLVIGMTDYLEVWTDEAFEAYTTEES